MTDSWAGLAGCPYGRKRRIGKPDCRASLAMTGSWAGLAGCPYGRKRRIGKPDCRASLAMTKRIFDHHAKGDSNDGFRSTLDIIKQTQFIEALCCFSTT
jgi:hypothetical protein